MTTLHELQQTLSPIQNEATKIGTNIMPRNPDVEVCCHPVPPPPRRV